MKEIAVIIAYGNDWTGLYINDILVMENHSLDLYQVLRFLEGNTIILVSEKWMNSNWLEGVVSLPDNVKDIVWENEEYTEEMQYGDDW